MTSSPCRPKPWALVSLRTVWIGLTRARELIKPDTLSGDLLSNEKTHIFPCTSGQLFQCDTSRRARNGRLHPFKYSRSSGTLISILLSLLAIVANMECLALEVKDLVSDVRVGSKVKEDPLVTHVGVLIAGNLFDTAP